MIINYYSIVATNSELRGELNDKLSNEFEDNIVNVFGKYITNVMLDDSDNARIAQFYKEAKDAYIDALAAIIMYPDALEYVD